MATETDDGAPNPPLPPEAERHGDYTEVTVVAEDGSQRSVKRNRASNPLLVLWERGRITTEQYEAGIEIARVAEAIGRAVGVRSASLEARVDYSGSAKNLLVEHIGQVRAEATYGRWRLFLPAPKRMVIDVIVRGLPLTVAMRRFQMRHAKVRGRVADALDTWLDLREKVCREIDEDELRAAHLRAGGGIIA